MKLRSTRGFTLVEIMIVVAIIGILIAIAVPGFIRARHTSRGRAIQNDLVKIDAAIQQYALDFNIDTEAGPPPTDMLDLVNQGYFRAEITPPIEGTNYVIPVDYSSFPTWDGTVPTGEGYDELYRHPDDTVGP